MTSNPVKDKLRRGETSVGTYLGLGSPQVTEVLARVGLEWLIIECEHSAVDIPHVEDMLRAMNGTDTVPIVRIPSADPVWIQRSLDIGGMGVLVPLVKTVDEAQAIVAATRYPPVGKRGFGPLRASNFYMNATEYVNSIDDNVLVALIVETKEFVDNLEAIASIDGVDVLVLGVRDLCFALGLDVNNPAYNTPEVDAVINQMVAVSKKTGVALGIHTFSPEQLQAYQQRGFHFLSYKTEYIMLIDQANEGLAAARG